MTGESVVTITPLGPIELKFNGSGYLEQVNFISEQFVHLTCSKPSKFAQTAVNWFECYFKNPQACNPLPLMLNGTPFQIRVWNELQNIPLGHTVTYGQLAKNLKTSARAIGLACRQNPLPIIIPCHRVVALSGMGGYCGHTSGSIFDRKITILNHEKMSLKEKAL